MRAVVRFTLRPWLSSYTWGLSAFIRPRVRASGKLKEFPVLRSTTLPWRTILCLTASERDNPLEDTGSMSIRPVDMARDRGTLCPVGSLNVPSLTSTNSCLMASIKVNLSLGLGGDGAIVSKRSLTFSCNTKPSFTASCIVTGFPVLGSIKVFSFGSNNPRLIASSKLRC